MLTSCVTFPKVIIKFSTEEEAEQARQVLDKFEIVKGFYLRVIFNRQWHGTNTENSKSRRKAERKRKFNAFGGGGEERAAIPPLAEREREGETHRPVASLHSSSTAEDQENQSPVATIHEHVNRLKVALSTPDTPMF